MELQAYMDALPACPWPERTKLEWVRGLVENCSDGPYPYPYDLYTKLEWVQWRAERDYFFASERAWAQSVVRELGL